MTYNRVTTEEMVESFLNQEPRDDIFTTVIPGHTQQMCLFGIRQGVEFMPAYDPTGERRETIERLIKESKVLLYLRSIWANLIGRGSVLFYLRPKEDFFEFLWFNKQQFKVLYTDGNVIAKVIIIYPFIEENGTGVGEIQKWVRLVITKDIIRQGIYDQNPSINLETTAFSDELMRESPNEIVVQNSLRIIPCVVVDNEPVAPGHRGESDFSLMSSQIEELNQLTGAASSNIEFFGNPTLVSTRPESQVLESAELSSPQYRGVATGSGFANAQVGIMSTRKFNYAGMSRRRESRLRVKRVIGSVEPDERLGYMVPDAVSGDQNRYINSLEEMIRTSLGGVYELGFHAGATALEINTLYGRVAATARRKAEIIYTHGLCRIFELLIAAQEYFFTESLKQAIQWDEEANGPFTEDMARLFAMGDPEQGFEPQPIPPSVVGLIPQGNRTIKWRWTGPVFEDTPNDKQMLSILMRNLTEEGISTLEAFKVIFPDRSDEEINALLGGVPFRRAQRIINLIQMLLGLKQGMMSLPANGPDNMGNVPMFALFGGELDNQIGLLISKLTEELNRGQQTYEPVRSSSFPELSGESNPFNSGSVGESLPGFGYNPGDNFQPIYPGNSGNAAPVSTDGAGAESTAGDAGKQRSELPDLNAYTISPAAATPYAREYGVANGEPADSTSNPWVQLATSVSPNGELPPTYGNGPGGFPGGQQYMEAGIRGFDQSTGYPGAGQPSADQPPELVQPIPAPGSRVSRSTAQRLFPTFSKFGSAARNFFTGRLT